MRNKNDVFAAYQRESDETKRVSFLPYYGGKGNLAKRIILMLSPTLIYIEGFGGGASVMLNRPRAQIEVYAEILPDIAAVFLAMRDDGENLIWELRYIPYARAAFEDARQANSVPDKITAMMQSINAHGLSGWSLSRTADGRAHGRTPISTTAWGTADRQGAANGALGFKTVSGNGATAVIVPTAADKITAIEQSINSHGLSGWRLSRSVDRKHFTPGGRITNAVKTAHRQGSAADKITAMMQSINSHGLSGWRHNRAIDDRKRGRGAALTSGSHTAFRHGAQDDTVNGASLPFGIIVPISGPEGIDILLSHRPMKCETLADAGGDVIALFAAARWLSTATLSARSRPKTTTSRKPSPSQGTSLPLAATSPANAYTPGALSAKLGTGNYSPDSKPRRLRPNPATTSKRTTPTKPTRS